jgi:ketosteroid isomerase-like protein
MRTKTLLLAAAFATLVSCGTGEEEKTHKLAVPSSNSIDVKNLMNFFNEAWNRKDSTALMALFANDMVMLAGRDKVAGKDSVAKTWLHATLPLTSNLRITDVQNGAGPEIAYSAGTWTMDITVPGQPVAAAAGNHNFIWKRVADSAWRLTFVSIENYPTP